MELSRINQRSQNMAAIKSCNTSPEIYIRKILFSEGYRYRINQKKLPGKPDIVLSKYKTVIFINGCFWHRHNCQLTSTPKSNIKYWTKKFKLNLDRDKKNYQALINLGWKIIIVWECSLRGKSKLSESTLKLSLETNIKYKSGSFIEISGIDTK